ncbi:MAG: hypothetical protein K8H86_05705 [Ignavibacteriaceae bacterium]|nr:hypothetical protein [Ignavibacteriaceae bacterium]
MRKEKTTRREREGINNMTENGISHQIIGDVVELYKRLGTDMLIIFNTINLKKESTE